MMIKKALTPLAALTALFVMTTAGVCADDEIRLWVSEETKDFTEQAIDTFKEENSDYADYSYIVEAVPESEVANRMLSDEENKGDVYSFAQDQIARLFSAGALSALSEDSVNEVYSENDSGSVTAATVGEQLCAYPLTSDNGYLLYYDSSVISDPSSLETILADCEAAGKNFYMEANSGWYQVAFFFATGCLLEYETDIDGRFTNCSCTYATDYGLTALKELIAMCESPAFKNGSSVADAEDCAAIVDGTWDAEAAKAMLGDNYACAILPFFNGSDGIDYQMSGFGGFKLLGVRPQEDDDKQKACHALAAYLSGGDMQLARFRAVGWGPSNVGAQQSEEVKANAALSALAEQLYYTIPQGQYPEAYWSLATTFGDRILNGELTSASSDGELMEALGAFEASCISLVD